MIADEELIALRAGWSALLGRYAVGEAAGRPVLDRLIAAYSSPERHYHTLEHVAEMLEVIYRLAREVIDASALELAVWFHDAVQDTHAADNEGRSAELAGELLTPLGVPKRLIDRVAEMVRATAHLANDTPPSDPDTAVLLDADLAILGSPPERYLRYARDVRLEYAWVPETDYRTGRMAVLQKFLDRRRIYHHRILFEEREERAQRNLAQELAILSDVGTVSPAAAL